MNPTAHDQFIVCHGKSGILGVFTAEEPMTLARGQAVIVQTSRGAEFGSVLAPASLRQARLLGTVSAGTLLRCANPADDASRSQIAEREQQIFDAARDLSAGTSIEVLDVDLLFQGDFAIVQFVGRDDDVDRLGQALEQRFGISVRLENVAMPKEEHAHGGCDKPDCGRSAGGGECTSCSTGDGCSSCGSAKVDLRPYFSHLRDKMQAQQRIPLV
ncbi:MAG TPA: hypothetical protein VFE62_22860 [Gemmataceae bacterium]|nr:hypothetical protein [Gemmataceae bacterium]